VHSPLIIGKAEKSVQVSSRQLAVGIFSLMQLSKVNQPAREVVHHHLANAIAFGKIDSNIQQVRAREFRHLLVTGAPKGMQAAEEAARENIQAVEEAFQQYEASMTAADNRQTFEEFKNAWQEYVNLHEQIGRWYCSSRQRDVGAYAEFQAIESLHARFHQLEMEIVTLVNRTQKEQAERLLSEALRAKDEIVHRLNALMNLISRRQQNTWRKAA
jgi:hypothetical protein